MSAQMPWALRSRGSWNDLTLSKPVFPPIKCIHPPEFIGSSWNKKTWPKNVILLIAKKKKLGQRKAETCKLSMSGNSQARLVENWGLWDNGERQAQVSICMMCKRHCHKGGQDSPGLQEVTAVSWVPCCILTPGLLVFKKVKARVQP